MEKIIINIQRDFSRYPAGRYRGDGPYNGEKFREDFLIPALKKSADKIYIELDGVRGYNSSFLDEAFGKLIRCGFSAKELLERLEFNSQDKSLIEEIIGYIKFHAKAKVANQS